MASVDPANRWLAKHSDIWRNSPRAADSCVDHVLHKADADVPVREAHLVGLTPEPQERLHNLVESLDRALRLWVTRAAVYNLERWPELHQLLDDPVDKLPAVIRLENHRGAEDEKEVDQEIVGDFASSLGREGQDSTEIGKVVLRTQDVLEAV